MRSVEKAVFVNMCMICDNEGNVVVQNRTASDWPGLTFPGGHVEQGESFTEAVIREVYEETGLSVKNLSLCGIKDWIQADGSRYVGLLYKTSSFSGELRSSSEGDVVWMKLTDMHGPDLAEGMDKMLELFLNEDLSELFYYKKGDSWIEQIK